MNPQSQKNNTSEIPPLTTEAVAEFIVIVGKAVVTNANHMAVFADLFETHTRQFRTMNLLTIAYLRQIFYLCLFNLVFLAWIIVHPLLDKSPGDLKRDTASVPRQVDNYLPQSERNSAP
jgi:hypothetical protein